jgi:hypothetical protein
LRPGRYPLSPRMTSSNCGSGRQPSLTYSRVSSDEGKIGTRPATIVGTPKPVPASIARRALIPAKAVVRARGPCRARGDRRDRGAPVGPPPRSMAGSPAWPSARSARPPHGSAWSRDAFRPLGGMAPQGAESRVLQHFAGARGRIRTCDLWPGGRIEGGQQGRGDHENGLDKPFLSYLWDP